MNQDTKSLLASVPALAILLALIFLLDLKTPLGYAPWVMYLLPVGASLLHGDPRAPLAVAVLASVASLGGFFLSAPGVDPQMAAINRVFGGAAVWATALAVHHAIETRNHVADLLWIQKGRGAIAKALQGDPSAEAVGRDAMRVLAELTGADVGVLYRLDGAQLVRSGGYAIDPGQVPETIDLPQGVVGEVAADGKLRVLDAVPPEHLPIRTALGQSGPARLVVAPVMADGQVTGVVELATLQRGLRREQMLGLLEAAASSIGSALRSAHYRERLVNLLEETQRQSEELQAQQEELRVSNEELEQQSRVLEASQTRLELQQADLEQSNVQLEEQTQHLERQKKALLAAQQALLENAAHLETANRYKSEFLANMSHELRTPLNSALILSRLLADNKEGTLTPTQVKYAKAIHASNNDLLALINDVLDLSKIEAGHMRLAIEPVEMAVLMERLRATFEPLAQQRGLALSIEVAPDVPATISTDSLRLSQILKNLMANAVKFTERGEVFLRVQALDAGRLTFAVHDSGVGIAPDQLEVIFEAFRQADGSTSRRFGGTGLGLSISRELARKLGGDIVAESEMGLGSRFTLTLPREFKASESETSPACAMPAVGAGAVALGAGALAAGALAADAPGAGVAMGTAGLHHTAFGNGNANQLAAPAHYARESTGGAASEIPVSAGPAVPAGPGAGTVASVFRAVSTASGRIANVVAQGVPQAAAIADDREHPRHPGRMILAVEDDLNFGQILVDLAREQGFDCVVAPTAADAMRLVREVQPNGILLDIGLPDESGLSVLDHLKRDPSTRHIPVHMVSLHDRTQTALELGAVGYLQKPAERDQLVDVFRKIEQRLRRTVRRLLIVEDDAELRASLELLLGDDKVQIVSVGSIADALAALEGSTFDCMVMDLTLPDGTGYDLLERISGGDRYAFPPVIVYTGGPLGREDEERLRRYSRSIIVKGARSPERLLDEVTLFLHSVESKLPANQQRLLRQVRQRDAVLEGRKILLAEDDIRNIFALSSVFEALGVKLEVARNGREALQRIEDHHDIDLVLMDIMMPEMDGLTAMREIRANRKWTSLPVIALTAKAMSDDRERCLTAGANDYIAKPINVDKLVSLCRVWMPR